jgi:two-component system sensor histidine kinase/response regulator
VQRAGESLLTLINDILDFSKLEARKLELERADFDPRRLIEKVASLLGPTAFDKKLELLAYCLPEVPHSLRGDAGRIRQVLLNLASNAVKFTSSGEVAIKVKSSPGEDGGLVLMRVEVSDTGIGIAEQDHQRLFESFSQADASTTRRYGGTGLGLAISRRLVEAMDGRMAMTSELGVGSTFWFEITLPLGTRPTEDLDAFSHDLLPGMRVLVVDDNSTNRLILESQLALWRLQPDAAEGAESALIQMRHRPPKADRTTLPSSTCTCHEPTGCNWPKRSAPIRPCDEPR